MSNSDHLTSLIVKAVHMQDPVDLSRHSRDLTLSILGDGEFSGPVFEKLAKLLGEPDFHRMSDSYYLVKVFQDNLEYLSTAQRAELASKIEKSYEYVSDATSCLLLAEITAALFPDDRSLHALQRLRQVKEETPRALVASGLEYFTQICSDSKL